MNLSKGLAKFFKFDFPQKSSDIGTKGGLNFFLNKLSQSKF